MMLRKLIPVAVALLASIAILGMGSGPQAAEAPRMTKEELKARLGSPDLVLLDVRTGTDWKKSDKKITGAVREDPNAFDSWAGTYPKDKTIVLYCA